MSGNIIEWRGRSAPERGNGIVVRGEVLLVGPPNVGKSTLFIALSGRRVRTGNREGVTVEAESADIRLPGAGVVRLTDLPGIRALPPRAPDERISVRALETAEAGAAVFVADALRLAEGLSLFSALRGRIDGVRRRAGAAPLRWVLAVNGCDRLVPSAGPERSSHSNGTDGTDGRDADPIGRVLDERTLARLVGVPAVGVSALRRIGIPALYAALSAALSSPDGGTAAGKCRPYGAVEKERAFPGCAGCAGCGTDGPCSDGAAAAIASSVLRGRVPSPSGAGRRIERIFDRPATGLPILLCLWGLMMLLAFGPPGNALCEVCARMLSPAAAWVSGGAARLPGVLSSLITEGLLGGVGAVLSFLPRLAILWISLAVLEETGLLPRAARLCDPFMRRLGLTGGALIPLLLGFGCTVPAVMATRTLPDADTRNAVIRLSPLVTCSARMPLFSLLAEAFFSSPDGGGTAGAGRDGWRSFLFCASLYLLSAALTLAAACVLHVLRRGPVYTRASDCPARPLPPLRLPSCRAVLSETADRLRRFTGRVAGVILLSSLLVWLLLHVDARMTWLADPGEASLLFRLGRAAGVLLRPLGLGHPVVAAALLAGLGAKEAVVSVLGICLSSSGDALPAALAASGWLTPASALSLAVFAAFYLPCTAALSAMRAEWTGRKRSLLPALLLSLLTAYFAALIVYSLARLMI